MASSEVMERGLQQERSAVLSDTAQTREQGKEPSSQTCCVLPSKGPLSADLRSPATFLKQENAKAACGYPVTRMYSQSHCCLIPSPVFFQTRLQALLGNCIALAHPEALCSVEGQSSVKS